MVCIIVNLALNRPTLERSFLVQSESARRLELAEAIRHLEDAEHRKLYISVNDVLSSENRSKL